MQDGLKDGEWREEKCFMGKMKENRTKGEGYGKAGRGVVGTEVEQADR